MRTVTFGSLFSGIGGFDLGLERADMYCKWQCEIDPFCNKVLSKHWPDVKRYGDIRKVGGHNLEPVDLICGGFPCQPFSVAGKRRGSEDDRYLWPEMLRVISEIKPTWVIGENVSGIINMEFDKVLSDLEAEGYETQTFIIPACAVDAPHRRDRVWIIAYNNKFNGNGGRFCSGEVSQLKKTKIQKSKHDVANASGERQPNHKRSSQAEGSNRNGTTDCCGRSGGEGAKWLPEPPVGRVGRVANGVSRRVDRLKSLGNAVVPQVVEVIGRFIMTIEDQI